MRPPLFAHTRIRHRPKESPTLHIEYAERGNEYGILFIFRLFSEYTRLEYVRIHVIYRVNQAKYGIHILVVALQEYVNTYSTRRDPTRPLSPVSGYTTPTRPQFGGYKIFFHLKAYVHESIILYSATHPHCPHCCTTIARLLRNIHPLPQPPYACHTPYNMGLGNIV